MVFMFSPNTLTHQSTSAASLLHAISSRLKLHIKI